MHSRNARLNREFQAAFSVQDFVLIPDQQQRPWPCPGTWCLAPGRAGYARFAQGALATNASTKSIASSTSFINSFVDSFRSAGDFQHRSRRRLWLYSELAMEQFYTDLGAKQTCWSSISIKQRSVVRSTTAHSFRVSSLFGIEIPLYPHSALIDLSRGIPKET